MVIKRTTQGLDFTGFLHNKSSRSCFYFHAILQIIAIFPFKLEKFIFNKLFSPIKHRFLKNISFSGIVNTIKIDLSILMSCKAGFLLTISLFCQQEVIDCLLQAIYTFTCYINFLACHVNNYLISKFLRHLACCALVS